MQEPSASLRWTMFFFAGGDAAIVGAFVLSIVVMVWLNPSQHRPIRQFHAIAGVIIGLMLVVCGSLQMPLWFKVATSLWLLFMLIAKRFRTTGTKASTEPLVAAESPTRRRLFSLDPIVWLMTWLIIEIPFHLCSVPAGPFSKVLVIGDSVTAGLNDNDDTWPRQLARSVDVQVLDASQPGATVHSARQQHANLAGRPGLLIVEIGGNDVLEGLPVAQFESELDVLLTEIVQADRSVVMFELPLPPLCAAYGSAQRRQVGKHGVSLIPKRLFTTVLTTKGATVDGIHLSNSGQSQMMHLVQNFFAGRFRSGTGTYEQLERRFTSN